MVFAVNYYMFTVSGLVLGFFLSALGTYTLPVELLPPTRRWIAGVWTTQMWSLGGGWLTLSTFLFRDWRVALQVNCIPFLVTLLYPFFIPESPRWLLKQGRLDDAVKAVKHISTVNGVKISTEHIREMLSTLLKDNQASFSSDNDTSILAIFKYPRVLVRFSVLCLIQ